MLVDTETIVDGNGALHGATWTARSIGPSAWVVSVVTEAEIVSALTDFVRSNRIRGGIVQGIGAIHRVVLSFRDPVELVYVDKTFDEQMEIVSLQGNIADHDGETLVHVHVHATLGRQDYSALAGHLKEAWTRGAGELFVFASDSPVTKNMDPALGLNIYSL